MYANETLTVPVLKPSRVPSAREVQIRASEKKRIAAKLLPVSSLEF